MLRRLIHRRRRKRLMPPDPTADATAWPGSGLHVCASCRRPFTCPMRWEPLESGSDVRLLVRCGQCGTWRELIVSSAVAERFRDDVTRAREAMADTLRRLEHASIDAADFGARP
jgi:hypothetical protein